ncbi:MAG: hypothetical protein BWY52_02410 [Chloroflexi bacterium ADurb.Bin325]|nr:MAG: hypothetical protein BWY52_02410 [Chloroflexi bacterium ADurb.Bin325]
MPEGLVRCADSGELELRGWYARPKPDVSPTPIVNFQTLKDHLQSTAPAPAIDEALATEAAEVFAREVVQAEERHTAIIHKRRKAHYLTVLAKARFLLLRAALVEIALGQSPNWIDGDVYPSAFNEQAVLGLQRHGFPWSALLKLAYTPELIPDIEDPFSKQIAGEKREALTGRLNQLKGEARELVKTLKAAEDAVRQAAPASRSAGRRQLR